MESKRVTVTDTPTLIHEAQRNHGSETVTLSIAGGLTNIDVGGPNVSSGAGYEMADGSREVLELRAGPGHLRRGPVCVFVRGPGVVRLAPEGAQSRCVAQGLLGPTQLGGRDCCGPCRRTQRRSPPGYRVQSSAASDSTTPG